MKNYILKIPMIIILGMVLMTESSHAIPDNGAVWIPIFESRNDGVIKVGKPLELVWATGNAIACSINSQSGGGPVALSGSTYLTPNSAGMMLITLTCVNQAGSANSKSISVNVNPADYPELLSFTVSPNTNLLVGQLVTISWSSAFTTDCELSGTSNQLLPNNGSDSYLVEPGNNTLKMTCFNADGDSTNTITRYITGGNPPPIINNFYIQHVNPNFYFLVWQSTADYCILDQTQQVLPNGSQISDSQGQIRNHFLTCYQGDRFQVDIITYYPPNNGNDPIFTTPTED